MEPSNSSEFEGMRLDHEKLENLMLHSLIHSTSTALGPPCARGAQHGCRCCWRRKVDQCLMQFICVCVCVCVCVLGVREDAYNQQMLTK